MASPNDMIWLNGIACRCRIGVSVRERARRQRLLVDVGLETDIRPAAKTDAIGFAVDYHAVERRVLEEMESAQSALVETVAERVAKMLLGLQPKVAAVTVRVHKFPAAMPKTAEVVVEIRRCR